MSRFTLSTLVLIFGIILLLGSSQAVAGEENWHYYFAYDVTTGECISVVSTDEENLTSLGELHSNLKLILIDDRPEIIYDPWNYKFDFRENQIRQKTSEEWYPTEINIVMTRESSLTTIPTMYGLKRVMAAELSFADSLGGGLRVLIENSFLGEIRLDIENKTLSIKLRGEPGTWGRVEISMPSPLISSDDVEVYLDNQPWEAEVGTHSKLGLPTYPNLFRYYISIAYPHSEHTLTISSRLISWYSQPLNLALIALAVVIVIGAVYRFKFRR